MKIEVLKLSDKDQGYGDLYDVSVDGEIKVYCVRDCERVNKEIADAIEEFKLKNN